MKGEINMREFANDFEVSKGFQSWLHMESRKFMASYGEIPYYFMKNELKNGVMEVFAVGEFYGIDPEYLPKYNPQKKVLVGYYLTEKRIFVDMRKSELKREVLENIKTISLEEYRKELYYQIFALMKKEAGEISEKTEDSWVNLDEKSQKGILTNFYISGGVTEVSPKDFSWENSLIEDRDVLRFIQGKTAEDIYEEIRISDDMFSSCFDILVNEIQNMEWMKEQMSSFVPDERAKIRRQIIANIRKYNISQESLTVLFDICKDDLQKEYQTDTDENFVLYTRMNAPKFFYLNEIEEKDFDVVSPRLNPKEDEFGDEIPRFSSKLSYEKIRKITTCDGLYLLYEK